MQIKISPFRRTLQKIPYTCNRIEATLPKTYQKEALCLSQSRERRKFKTYSEREIGVGFWQGKYYIQATYESDPDFSKPLKWEKRGRRSHGQWWQYLAEPYCSIAEGHFSEAFKSDRDMQQYIIDNVNQLKDIIKRHHRTASWKKAVGSHEHWETFIWYWDMLACQMYSDGERTLYMDIFEDGNSGNVLIHFANRNGDLDMLKNALKRMGCQDRDINEE